MTADGSEGVILWGEDPGFTSHHLVQRQDFTVDTNGDLILAGDPVKLLPLAGEEVPPEDRLTYHSMDIWGDATHDSLYLAIYRHHFVNSVDETIVEVLIYNLNDMTDVREIYLTAQNAGEWDCPDPSVAPFPQFVPTCYGVQGIRFNPSGTRLYIQDNIFDRQDQRWDAALRIDIDRVDAMGVDKVLTDWTFSTPELVYAWGFGAGGAGGDGDVDLSGILARPDNDPSVLPSPELIAVRYLDIGGDAASGVGAILDADQCAADYAPLADGTLEAPVDLWRGCLETSTFFAAFNRGGGDSWQTPDALITSTQNRSVDPLVDDLYRRYVAGPLAGTEQLLIENAGGADTGL
ncbi:protein of unknown function [uncultured Woeseiaceae bacterium]|uniref:Uncharacterized protein n=1 Tax=uncultured Woeseiaceae bacterium TaxID=1983305 RepID=A0A7D9D182_9GAMM|nr:protein of unknown function [uncultured Woeseiaceae bacterium]